MNKQDITHALEKLLLINFSFFLIFVPFSNISVKICSYAGFIFWLTLNIMTLKTRFLRGFMPVNPINKPILFFVYACVFSILFGLNPYQSQAIFFDRYLMFFALFFTAAGLVYTYKRGTRIIAGVFVAWNFIFAAGTFWDQINLTFIHPNPALRERIWSIFGTNIPYYGFPLYLTFFIPFNIFLFLLAKNKWFKWAGGINIVLLLTCLTWNASRIAWAGVLASLILIFTLRNKKILALGAAIFVLMLSMSFAFPKNLTRRKTVIIPSRC